jgi:hypothetical protein
MRRGPSQGTGVNQFVRGVSKFGKGVKKGLATVAKGVNYARKVGDTVQAFTGGGISQSLNRFAGAVKRSKAVYRGSGIGKSLNKAIGAATRAKNTYKAVKSAVSSGGGAIVSLSIPPSRVMNRRVSRARKQARVLF